MSQKVLLAMDDSENALRAAGQVAKIFTLEAQVTLFSVVQDVAALCDMNSPELVPVFKSEQQSFCRLEDQKKMLVTKAMEKAKAMLLDSGFKNENVRVKVQQKKKGIAQDIVAEAETGYDLIVIGRRGVSGVKEFFFGSISQKVMHLAKDQSILIVT